MQSRDTLLSVENSSFKWHRPLYLQLRSTHSLSAVRNFSGGHSGRQLPVFLSLATRQTLHSVGKGFPDDNVLQPEKNELKRTSLKPHVVKYVSLSVLRRVTSKVKISSLTFKLVLNSR